MSRQHGNPYLVSGDRVYQYQRDANAFDEGWLQNFVFTFFNSIPVNEIEPAFGPLIPVCRELPTSAGPIDVLFVNGSGLLTLVECKLWKNPEARREVVGQILDYAKEISEWSYEDLHHAINRVSTTSLYDLVSQNTDKEIDERDFIDNVSRNLRRGRFLLLIIGDGIRENVEHMTDFLQKYAHLNFGFALVEFGVFKLSDQRDNEWLVQPRVIAQTTEIERAVFRIDDGKIVPSAPMEGVGYPTDKRKREEISQQVFFEELDVDSKSKAGLKDFLEKAKTIGLYLEPGQNGLMLKSNLDAHNFGRFDIKGIFYNCGIALTTEAIGQPQVGEAYLNHLASLLPNGFVKFSPNRFWWTAKIKDSKGERYATVTELLAVQDEWLALIQRTLDEISRLQT